MNYEFIKRLVRFPFELRARLNDWRLSRRPHRLVSICAIFRNEEAVIEEWLRFHLSVGCEHFYLYSNSSTDRTVEILRPYIDKGLVTLTDWPKNPGQIPAYWHCIQNHSLETKHIAFIDLDEFLFAPGQGDIRPALKKYGSNAALGVTSYYYGSSGHQTPPGGPFTSSYIRRARDRVSFKSIVNPRWVRRILTVHYCDCWGPKFPNKSYVDFDGKPRETPASTRMLDPDELRINHYWSRSIEELTGRKTFRSAVHGVSRRDKLPLWLEIEKKMNEVEDRSILDVIERMKQSAQK
jgi:hypothetical protein